MEDESRLENIIRKLAIAIGGGILIASIYLSYDGFDQKVGNGNNYVFIAIVIGYAIAIACTLLQFIVASRNENLSSTLRWLGVAAYVYSISTNYLGLVSLLGMDKIMAGIVAAFMDIAPEQMIAWGLGEAVMHDLFGNFGKFASAPIGKKGKGGGGGGDQQRHQQKHQQKFQRNQRGDDQRRPQQQYQSQYRPGMGQGMSENDARSMIEQIRKNGGKK